MSKITTTILNRILIVTINRPEVKNAVDSETAGLLHDTFIQFDQNSNLDIAILTGADGVFCAGADLKAIAMMSREAPAVSLEGKAPLGISRLTLSKPVIASVEGFAVAGGLELALWCDLRIAAEDAVFGVFCRRFGVPLVDGGTIRLPRLIGHSHAMDLILTGRGVHGKEAKSMGLANRIVPKGEALPAALELAKTLTTLPQLCMRSDRLSAIEQWDMTLKEALLNEAKRGLKVIDSGETVDGARRFVDNNF